MSEIQHKATLSVNSWGNEMGRGVFPLRNQFQILHFQAEKQLASCCQ